MCIRDRTGSGSCPPLFGPSVTRAPRDARTNRPLADVHRRPRPLLLGGACLRRRPPHPHGPSGRPRRPRAHRPCCLLARAGGPGHPGAAAQRPAPARGRRPARPGLRLGAGRPHAGPAVAAGPGMGGRRQPAGARPGAPHRSRPRAGRDPGSHARRRPPGRAVRSRVVQSADPDRQARPARPAGHLARAADARRRRPPGGPAQPGRGLAAAMVGRRPRHERGASRQRQGLPRAAGDGLGRLRRQTHPRAARSTSASRTSTAGPASSTRSPSTRTCRVPPGTSTHHTCGAPAPAQVRTARAAAHAPVPQDCVSPTPRSCTRIRTTPEPSARSPIGTTSSTFEPSGEAGLTTGGRERSADASSAGSLTTRTVCGLPMSTLNPGRATSRPGTVTSASYPASTAAEPPGNRHAPISTAYQGGAAPWYAVEMGAWRLPGGSAAVDAGYDAEVTVPGLDVARPGLSVDMGNPHTVLVVSDPAELASADLSRPPVVSPASPEGSNVELVVPMGERADGSGVVRMRVHERGVGETQSCGTGACAAALAVRTWAGAGAPEVWWVEVPGGTLRVRVLGDRVELAGPAVLVLDAEVDLAALGCV